MTKLVTNVGLQYHPTLEVDGRSMTDILVLVTVDGRKADKGNLFTLDGVLELVRQGYHVTLTS